MEDALHIVRKYKQQVNEILDISTMFPLLTITDEYILTFIRMFSKEELEAMIKNLEHTYEHLQSHDIDQLKNIFLSFHDEIHNI